MKTVREIPTWAHGEVHERVKDIASQFYYLYERAEAIYGAAPRSSRSQDKDVWRIRWVNDIVTPGGLMSVELIDDYWSGLLGLGAESRPDYVSTYKTSPDGSAGLHMPSAGRDRFMSKDQYLAKLHDAQVIGSHLLQIEVALDLAVPPTL